LEVVGAAASGEDLVEHLETWNPDVVTLDLSMPGMGGLPTLDRIMAWKPIPVIILSTQSSKDAPITIESLYRGAVDFIDKQQYSLVDFGALRAVLVGKILQFAAGAKPRIRMDEDSTVSAQAADPVDQGPAPERRFEVLLIGASAGGPPALER